MLMKEIAWVKAALKDFGDFPQAVQDRMKDALAIAAMGQKADIAKPMKGLGAGVMDPAVYPPCERAMGIELAKYALEGTHA